MSTTKLFILIVVLGAIANAKTLNDRVSGIRGGGGIGAWCRRTGCASGVCPPHQCGRNKRSSYDTIDSRTFGLDKYGNM